MKKQLVTIGLLTGVGQVVAFIKMWLVARYFGVGAELDGYNLAFVLPTLVSGVISGALQTGLFPVYAQLRLRSPHALARLERTLLLGLLSLGGAISVVFFFAAPQLGLLVAKGASPEAQHATVFVLRFAAFTVVLNAVGDFLGYLLALHQRYVFAAAAPIAGAFVGAVLFASWPQGGLTNLAAGTLLGIVAQLAIVFRGIKSTRVSFFGAGAGVADIREELRELLQLSGWILPGVIFANLTVSLPPVLIATFGEGAVSAFGYAFRFHQSAIQLLIMAVSPVILARFSDLVAARDWVTLQTLQRKAYWVSVVLGVTAVIVVALAGKTLLELALGYGRFDDRAVSRVAAHWLVLSFGMGISLYGNALAKRIQASKGAKSLSWLALFGTTALVVSTLFLRGWLEEMSVPAALVIGTAVPTISMSILLRTARFRRYEGRGAPVRQAG